MKILMNMDETQNICECYLPYPADPPAHGMRCAGINKAVPTSYQHSDQIAFSRQQRKKASKW